MAYDWDVVLLRAIGYSVIVGTGLYKVYTNN